MDDQYFFVPCRSKSACGRTNGQAVDSPHNALTSSAWVPDNALTNVSPTVVQSRISCEGRDQSVAAGRPTPFRNSFRNRTFVLFVFINRSMTCSKTNHCSDNRIKISESCRQRQMSTSQCPPICIKCPRSCLKSEWVNE